MRRGQQSLLLANWILTFLFVPAETLSSSFKRPRPYPAMKKLARILPSPRMRTRTSVEKQIDKEMLKVSFFSFLHSAAMPFSDLVDGSFLSTLDANSLGAVGVVRASQNSVSKLYNSPLSKTTISLIASAPEEKKDDDKEEDLPTAISSSLALALFLGSIQALVFVIGARHILAASGIHASSAMYLPAMAFMRARALSAPTSTLWLVATNVFRGLGDASTPMVCAILFNVANLIGDYILIEKLKVGIAGTAFGTTIAQFVALIPLLVVLNKKVPFWTKLSPNSFVKYLSRYSRAGFFLVGRSVARIAAVSYISRRSALFGSVSASSYSVLYQIGMWVTIISDGVSIATQSLLSRHLSHETEEGVSLSRFVIRRSFQIGIALSSSLAVLLFTFRKTLISLLTKSPEIQAAAMHAFPIFLLAQVAKGFAFPVNGLIMGGMDWQVSMWSMCFANLSCFLALQFLAESSVRGLWIAWASYYLAQGLAGLLRYKSRTGIWRRLKRKKTPSKG